MPLKDLSCVITGSFGFKDIGDEAMLTEDLRFLVDECGLRESNISLIGHIPDYVSYYHKHPIENCFSSRDAGTNSRALMRKESGVLQGALGLSKDLVKKRRFNKVLDSKVQSADFALITGGGTINSRSRDGGSLKRMHALVNYFKRHKKPIFISGQTFGPLGEFDDHDRLAKEIVSSADVLTVRDHKYSSRYLDLLEVKPKVFLETFDDAYSLPFKDSELPLELEAFVKEGSAAAFCVTDYTSDTYEKLAYLTKFVETCLLEGIVERFVFVSHTPKDLQSLFRIQDMLRNDLKDRVMVPDIRLWQGAQLKKLISLCKVAIGGRYHFIVFAGSSDTPFVGTTGNHYSYVKQDGFARPLGLEALILTEKETWDIDHLIASVKKAMTLSFSNSERFQRPSDSMVLLKKWLEETFGDNSKG